MKKNIHVVLSGILLLMISASGWSQQYVINGHASSLGNECFQLTPQDYYKAGSVWFQNKVTLNADLRVEGTLNFGNLDGNGADGIAFVLQAICNGIGAVGGGIGYQNISPSLAVEFDTWQNEWCDPGADHIALMRNGNISHCNGSSMQGPTSFPANIENGANHPFVIDWNSASKTIKVWLDNTLYINFTGDIVNTIFNGNHNVFWGFTGATGAAINNQRVCITSKTYTEEGSYTVTQPTCPGYHNGAIDLNPAGGISPFSYLWSNGATTEDISGITAGTYSVVVTDGHGCQSTYSIVVTNAPDVTPPEITCPVVEPSYPADIDLCSASLSFAASATDVCGIASIKYYIGTDEITFPHPFPVGSTTVKAVATDVNNLTKECFFTVVVVDTQMPLLVDVPADETVECDAVPSPPAVTATDNCGAGPVSFWQSPLVLTKLVHHWNADGNYLDAAGSGNGTPVGSITFGPPILGSNSFSFNGNMGYLSTGTGGSISGTGNFSVSAWIKTTGTGPMVIIQQRQPGDFYGEYILKIGGNHSNSVLKPGKLYFLVYDSEPVVDVFSNISVNDGKWHHVVGEREGVNIRIYIDGVLDGSAAASHVLNLNGTFQTTIGRDIRDNASNFNGLIDDVRVWSAPDCPNSYDLERVWTSQDAAGNQVAAVQELAVQDLTPPVITCPPDLILCYPNRNDPTGEATATDNCSGQVTVIGDKPAELIIGDNYIHWTATDVCGNSSTCTQTVTVSGPISVAIEQSNMPDFCQYQGVQLTAVVTGTPAESYLWSTNETTPTIRVSSSGTYSVVVTNALGCTADTSFDAVVSITDLLSSYTMLTRNHIKLQQTTVLSGGLGVKHGKDGKIEAKHSSTVTAAGTFAKANHITTDNSSVIASKYIASATVPWPAFEEMTGNGTVNIHVPDNSIMTVNGSLYREVKVGKNATLIFTSPVIDISKKMTLEEGAKLDFGQCATLHMKEKLEAKKNITINPSGLSVVFYIDDDVHIDEGAHVTGVFYLGDANAADTAKHHMHIGDSKAANPAVFTGLFLAECIHSGKYTTWAMNPDCNKCTKSTFASDEESAPVVTQEIQLKNFPNPFTGKTEIFMMLPADDHVSLVVYDITGREVTRIFSGDVTMNQEYRFEFSGTGLSTGTYFCKLTTKDKVILHKMVLIKD